MTEEGVDHGAAALIIDDVSHDLEWHERDAFVADDYEYVCFKD